MATAPFNVRAPQSNPAELAARQKATDLVERLEIGLNKRIDDRVFQKIDEQLQMLDGSKYSEQKREPSVEIEEIKEENRTDRSKHVVERLFWGFAILVVATAIVICFVAVKNPQALKPLIELFANMANFTFKTSITGGIGAGTVGSLALLWRKLEKQAQQ